MRSPTPPPRKITEGQIARLGNDLTPLGGERAGNADGTIPEWTGGITTPPDGYVVGEHHRDPYSGDQPLFVINAANLDEHRDKLSVGHQRILETYPSFEMQVYPTRRSASAPQRIYDATRSIAATANLVDDGNGRRRRGNRHPVPDPVQRPGSRLEPPAALPGRDDRLHHWPGRRDPRRRLHGRQIRP